MNLREVTSPPGRSRPINRASRLRSGPARKGSKAWRLLISRICKNSSATPRLLRAPTSAALTLDAQAGDPRSKGIDWFNYGQFLSKRGASPDLAYACFVRAENLLESNPSPELETARRIRRQTEVAMGRKASTVRENLPHMLSTAASLDAAPPAQ